MRNCIIIHGGPLDSSHEAVTDLHKKHWLPWVKDKLLSLDTNTCAPEMPNPMNPSYDDWKRVLDSLDVGPNTVLVGHSRGCAFILRWLMDTEKCVNKII